MLAASGRIELALLHSVYVFRGVVWCATKAGLRIEIWYSWLMFMSILASLFKRADYCMCWQTHPRRPDDVPLTSELHQCQNGVYNEVNHKSTHAESNQRLLCYCIARPTSVSIMSRSNATTRRCRKFGVIQLKAATTVNAAR